MKNSVVIRILINTTQFRKAFFSCYILLVSLSICGQRENVYFHALKQGISNQYIKCILKDSKGFMWFGTQNGLTRYDGINFVVYESNPNDSNSLSYNNVSAILEDKNKNIWISTFRGLNFYNRDLDNFIRIDSLQRFVISSMCEDNYNNIWVGTIGNGLIRYNTLNKEVEKFASNDSDIHTVNSKHITNVVIDNKSRLWIASWNGLDLFDIRGKTRKHFEKKANDPTSLSDNFVNALFLENNTLWVGTLYGGLNKLSISDNKFTFKHYLNENKGDNITSPGILCLFADKHKNLWMGTENKGLIRLKIDSGTINRYYKEEGNPYTLSSNIIRSIYVDDLNILWIGTLGRGLNFVDERFNRFELFQKNLANKYSLGGEDVRSFAEDKQGNVWIASYSGISMFNIKTRTFHRFLTRENGGLTTNAVNSLVFDQNENLWVGTLGGGIDCFNKQLRKIGNFKIKGPQKAGENKINILYVDKKNNLWAGSTGSGLFRFDKSKNSFSQVFDESQGILSSTIGYVNTILEDSENNLWVGTAYKLFCLKDAGNKKYAFESFMHTNISGSIPSDYVTSLFEDKHKNLWIGSLDQGLFLLDKRNKSFASFQKQDGLPSNTILGILEDSQENLWISTNKGLVKFNVSEKKFRNYTIEDGLVSNELGGYGCCLKAKDGEFLLGSSEGFNIFYPEKIRDNTVTQPIVITDFKLFNQAVKIGKGSPLLKSIRETRKIILNHNQSSFTIEFAALNYIQGSKNQYSYILEGIETEWNIVNHRNFASYNYLKPGKYLFKVKGSNNDGIWNDTPAALEIIILPPFWQTKWAYGLYLLIFMAAIFAIIQYRVARAKQIHLTELNQMKLQFFSNISHELRTPLSLIISPIENILTSAKVNNGITRQLELIYKNANRLVRLVNEIMDFSRAVENKLSISVQLVDIVKFTQELSFFFSDEALRRQITYKFEAKPTHIDAWFDKDKYEKIILNLLSNAFKFTQDNGTISIKIEKLSNDDKPSKKKKTDISEFSSKEVLKICVTDNGIGISPTDLSKIFEQFYQGSNKDYSYQQGSGIGLFLTKTLVELHYGKIFVVSEVGESTCFTILMPLGNSHFKKSEIMEAPINVSSKALEKRVFFPVEDKEDKAKLSQNMPAILLVEDNYELRKYIVSVFSAKYRMLEAENGEIGYKLAYSNIPDLIISDIIMPKLSGIELCKLIKENIITSHIPFILLTAKITLEERIDGIETGADVYITKPFNVKYLEVVIKNLIETRKKIFKRFSQEMSFLPKEISNNPLDQYFLDKIINHVEQNITNTGLSVEDIATHLLMSQGHTWRKVKALTGLTTNEFIRTIRLKNALKLMEEYNLNISEIAYKVGFSSPAYFTKCFKDLYGKSPSSFLSDKKKDILS